MTRERRKLKHLAELVRQGKMTREQFIEQYKGWRGDKKRYDAHGIILKTDKLFKDLLGGMNHG